MTSTPTESEERMAKVRAELADAERAEMGKAIAILGPGKTAYASHVQKDRTGKEPDRVVYCCRDDSHTGWQPTPPDNNERIEGGLFRWVTYFNFIGAPGKTYRPKTAQELAQGRERREEKKIEKLAEDMPLFAEEVRDGTLQIKNKNRLLRERREALKAVVK